MMLDRLNQRAAWLAQVARRNALQRLSKADVPDGITLTTTDDSIILSGRDLRRALISDPRIRRFGR
jgi:hypothetical protein